MKRRTQLVAGLLAAVLSIGLAACGGGDDDDNETFREDGFGISFSYPGDFEPGDVEGGQSVGGEADQRTAVSLDEKNGITVARSDLGVSITGANLAAVKPQYDARFAQLVGRPVKGRETEVGGLPALEYAPLDAAGVITRSTVVFDGDVQYQINCQWTDKKAEVEDACALALESLRRSGSS